jgi:NAD-dependent SIR2 family protein deacetylase
MSHLINLFRCDLLFVMGTSLQVYPFAFLVNSVHKDVPRILINKERVGPWEMGNHSSLGKDIMVEGDVDEGVAKIEEYFKF